MRNRRGTWRRATIVALCAGAIASCAVAGSAFAQAGDGVGGLAGRGGTMSQPPATQPVPSAGQLSAEDQARAEEMIARAIAFLRSKQDATTGGWSVQAQGPTFPAISALALNGMLMQPGISADDPNVQAGVAFLLRSQQADGGIYLGLLPSYNTAISLSALGRLPRTPELDAAIKRAQDFVRSLQYGEGAIEREDLAEGARKVDRNHPYYGGLGYGNRGRPDMSNLAFAMQGLRDSGVPSDDPFFQRALVFLQRCQMLDKTTGPFGDKVVNDQPYAQGSSQGGFIYATSVNKDNVGLGNSFAGEIMESTSGSPGSAVVVVLGSGADGKARTIASAELERRLREATGGGAGSEFLVVLGPTGDARTSGALTVRSSISDPAELAGLVERVLAVELGLAGAGDAAHTAPLRLVAHSAAQAREVVDRWLRPGDELAARQPWERVAVDVLGQRAAGVAAIVAGPVEQWGGASRLRAYGTMSYAGFKSYLYAGLSREDPRVTAVRGWISDNYTLRENPGLGTDGFYYYMLMFSRAMHAFGEPTLPVRGRDGTIARREWATDLVRRLGELQEPDGGFRSVDDRWMEDNRVLITAYCLLALQHAAR